MREKTIAMIRSSHSYLVTSYSLRSPYVYNNVYTARFKGETA